MMLTRAPQRCGSQRGTQPVFRTRHLSLKRRARAQRARGRPSAAQRGGQGADDPRRAPWFAGALLSAALSLAVAQRAAAGPADVDEGQGFLPPLHLDEASLAAPAQGVTPILTEDTDQATLDELLSQAMSYIREGDKSKPASNGKVPASEREDLIRKLRSEQARLKDDEEDRKRQKDEQQAAANKAKAEAAARAKEEEAVRRTEAEAQRKQREEEAARRQRDEVLRKAMEARMKEEKESRQRAEKERQDAMIARELEAEKRKIERVLAAAGGASVGVGISFFVEAFRIIGGPTIVAQILRTPGFVVGRTFRLIEWDLETSPQEPNGDMVSVQVRQGQLTRHGIRECIAKTYGLQSPKSVKQYAHFFQVGLRVFYERIDTKETIGKLDEGDIIVWSRTSPSVLLMPGRNDKRPKVPKVGEQTVPEKSTTSNPIATADQDMVAAVVAVCAMSRGEDASHVLLPSQKRSDSGDEAAPRQLTSAPAADGARQGPPPAAKASSSSRNPNPAAKAARPLAAAVTPLFCTAEAADASPSAEPASANAPERQLANGHALAAAIKSIDAEAAQIDSAAVRALSKQGSTDSGNGASPAAASLDDSDAHSEPPSARPPARRRVSADMAGRFDGSGSDLSAQTVMLEKFGAEARHALEVGATVGTGLKSIPGRVHGAAQEFVGTTSARPRHPAPLLPAQASHNANGHGRPPARLVAGATGTGGGPANNGTEPVRSGGHGHGGDRDADLPELAWKRVRRMADPAAFSAVRAAIARLGRISEAEEAAIVAAAASQDPTVVRLYEWYGDLDVFRFVRYAGAHCDLKQGARERERTPALT